MGNIEVDVGGADAKLPLFYLVLRGVDMRVVSWHAVVLAILFELERLKGVFFSRVEEDGRTIMLVKLLPVCCLSEGISF